MHLLPGGIGDEIQQVSFSLNFFHGDLEVFLCVFQTLKGVTENLQFLAQLFGRVAIGQGLLRDIPPEDLAVTDHVFCLGGFLFNLQVMGRFEMDETRGQIPFHLGAQHGHGSGDDFPIIGDRQPGQCAIVVPDALQDFRDAFSCIKGICHTKEDKQK